MKALLLFVLLASGAGAHAADAEAADEYVSGIAVGLVREQDSRGGPDLDGYRVAFTAFSRGEKAAHRFAGSYYVEWKESRSQEILEAGAEISYPYVEFSRVGLGPRLRLALQERAEPPHRGTDAAIGVGFELGVWLSEGVQIAAMADRSMGFEAGTRNSFSVNLRVMFWND